MAVKSKNATCKKCMYLSDNHNCLNGSGISCVASGRPDEEYVIFSPKSILTPKQQLPLAKKEIRKRQKDLTKAWVAYEKLCDKINKENKKGVIR